MFDTIRKNSLPIMTHYQGDLDIDQKYIEDNPGVEFLHWTRASGTLLVILWPADKFPVKEGKFIPYLFSFANRKHIIDEIITMSRYYTDPAHDNCKLVQYFDGKAVKKITAAQAAEIGRNHANKLWAHFEREKREREE